MAVVGQLVVEVAHGTVFSELYGGVQKLSKINKPLLDDLQITLDSLKPIVDEMRDCNDELDPSCKEIATFHSKIEKGVNLVCKLSTVDKWYKNRTCIKQLAELNGSLKTHIKLGYAVIDIEILNQSEIEDICMSKFTALVLKFISQRNRPIRGSTSKLLLDYMHSLPCKTSQTAAGCYITPAPGSKGMKALVCVSVDSPLPLKMGLSRLHFQAEQEHSTLDEIEQIIADSKSYADSLVPNASDVHFLEGTPESILTGARKLGMISESPLQVPFYCRRKKLTISSLVKSQLTTSHSMESNLLVHHGVNHFNLGKYVAS